MSEHIGVRREGPVLVIRFERPEKKNAITRAMYAAMASALEEADRDPSVRAVLFTAAGDVFTAGNDLGDFMGEPPASPDSPVLRFLRALSSSRRPIVAAVGGKAVGVGVTMLLHCDLVYASERAQLVAPFVDLGLVPEAASSLLLPRLLGHQRAAELLLLGEPMSAAHAQANGLVNALVPAAELDAHALSVATRLAAKPPTSLALTKKLLKDPGAQSIPERIELEGQHFVAQLGSPEVREAITAFFERRAPDFSKMQPS